MRPIEQPKEGQGHDGKAMTHPAFGQVVISKVQGRRTLYGSDFDHNQYVEVTLFESELRRDLSHEWPYSRKRIVSFCLSEAQWAAMVSSFGNGSGTQVTISEREGVGLVPSFPLRDAGQFFKAEGDARVDIVDQRLVELEAAVAETTLSGKAKSKLLDKIRSARQEIKSNLPFVAKSFSEHLETRVEKAKVEVNAWIQNTIMRAGLGALAKDQPLQIETRKDDTSGEAP
jgi:hypothetical protein